MPKSSAVQFTLAAALVIATSASPVLAKGDTRSFQSLPSAFSHRAPQTQQGFAQGFSGVSGVERTPSNSFRRDNDLPGRLNWRNPWRFVAVFARLPLNVQQAIADALSNAGERGERLCRLLGIPECQLPDSTG
jgi:hypothetical protein